MSVATHLFDGHKAGDAYRIADPGNAGTIRVNRSPAYCGLVSAGAETRTLNRPTQRDDYLFLAHEADGGDITLTVTGGYNEDGDTVFTFTDPGQWALFVSMYETVAAVYQWRKVSDYSTSNLTPTEAAFLNGVTAGTVTASKAVVVDANKDIGTFRVMRGARYISQEGAPSSSNNAGANTITAAILLSGIYVRDPNGAGRTDTFDSAANIVAALPGAAVGDVIRLLIVNGADAAETITLAVPASGAFDANQTAASRVIIQNTSKVVHLRLTNVTPTTEAYVVYA